jgi:hypothetical protein
MSTRNYPSTPKPRHKRKLELQQIHVDELLNAAGMSGFLGALEAPQPSPHLHNLASEMLTELESQKGALPERYEDARQELQRSARKAGIPETGIPNKSPIETGRTGVVNTISGTPETGIPFSTTSGEIAVSLPAVPVAAIADCSQAQTDAQRHSDVASPEESDTGEKGIPETGIPEEGIPSSLSHELLSKRRVIRQAQFVQDGHSYGEQLVYQSLWNQSQPHSADGRIVSIGYRTLAALCHLTVNNCKANLQSLVRKLAIEEASSYSHTQGRTYLIHSFQAILRRRRAAGLTHYIKTRGVAFVNPETGAELSLIGIPVSGIPINQSGIPETGESGAPETGTPSLDNLMSTGRTSSSSPSLLASTLDPICGPVDDDALRRLEGALRLAAPSITDEELVWLVQFKAGTIHWSSVRNPIGFLLTALPRCVEGGGLEALRRYRAGAEAPPVAPTEWHTQLQHWLNDPQSSEQDRQFARRLLSSSL